MPVTIETVRTTAFALPGVVEGEYHGTPAFYVRRKMMLRLRGDAETLVVAFPKEERAELIARQPDVFSLTDHYLDYDWVLLSLLAADEACLHQMIEGAWRIKAAKKHVLAYDATRANPAAIEGASGAVARASSFLAQE